MYCIYGILPCNLNGSNKIGKFLLQYVGLHHHLILYFFSFYLLLHLISLSFCLFFFICCSSYFFATAYGFFLGIRISCPVKYINIYLSILVLVFLRYFGNCGFTFIFDSI